MSLSRTIIAVFCAIGFSALETSAAEAAQKQFSIAAGPAAETLKQFAEQSGRQLVYSATVVPAEVKTQAINGVFAPRDALTHMLNGSGLSVTEDAQSGALAISRVQVSDAREAAPTAATGEQQDARPGNGEEPVKLSPFEVIASTDTGYLATETLSGTRMRSQVRDLSNSMTIMTEDFLDDIGAIDFNDALNHAPSTANFDVDDSDATGNSQRFNTNFRVRGFRLSSLSLDFFPTAGGGGGIPLDRYNTESIAFSRGPNSILFGISSPAGLINVSSKKGLLDKPITKVEFRVASEDSHRVALDVNRALVPGKVALRVAMLNQDIKDFRHNRNQRKSGYGSLLIRPVKKLSIYLNYEKGSLDKHVTSPVIAYDYYTPWAQAGKPIDTTPGNGTGNVAGLDMVSTTNYLVYIPGQSSIPIMNWRRMSQGALPRNPLTGATENRTSLSDPSILPLTIDLSGPHDRYREDFSILENLWQMQPLPNFYVELGAWREERRNLFDDRSVNIADQAIRVDPNAYLPDGTPNPNVGRPYVEAVQGTSRTDSSWTASEYRVSLNYELDLSRHKWGWADLGFHRILGLWDRREQSQVFNEWDLVNTTPLPGFSPALNNGQNLIHTRSYLELGADNQYIQGDFQPFSQNGVNANYMRTGGARNNLETTESRMIALQSYFFERRLVTVMGLRRDENSVKSAKFARDGQGLYADPYQAMRDSEDLYSGNTTSLGVVYHLTDHWSLTYNRSKSFNPAGANFNIYNEVLPPTTGVGEDFGVKFDFFKSRLTGSLVYFQTAAKGQSFNQSSARGNKNAWINSIWDVIDPSRAITNTQWRDTEDFEADGWELQLVANPTKRWRMALAASLNENKLLAFIPHFQHYYAEYRSLWSSPENVNRPVAATNGGGSTVGQVMQSLDRELAEDLAQIGSNANGMSKYQVDFTTAYTLPDMGPFRSIRLGGNYHWKSPRIIGYGTDANGVITSEKKFLGSSKSTIDAWIGMQLPFGKKRAWKIQLNVSNVFDVRDRAPLFATQGIDGPYYSAYTLERPRTWMLTNTFEF